MMAMALMMWWCRFTVECEGWWRTALENLSREPLSSSVRFGISWSSWCYDDNGNSNEKDYVNSNYGELSGRVGFVEEECDNKFTRRVLATTHARWVHSPMFPTWVVCLQSFRTGQSVKIQMFSTIVNQEPFDQASTPWPLRWAPVRRLALSWALPRSRWGKHATVQIRIIFSNTSWHRQVSLSEGQRLVERHLMLDQITSCSEGPRWSRLCCSSIVVYLGQN